MELMRQTLNSVLEKMPEAERKGMVNKVDRRVAGC
jgi:hypothetical protein